VLACISTGSLNKTLKVDFEPSQTKPVSLTPQIWQVSACNIYNIKYKTCFICVQVSEDGMTW